MAWTAPMTAVSGAAFTASQFNASIRDNLLQTAAAKATAAGGYFVGTGANTITQRFLGGDFVSANESTTTTTYVDLATVGPTVTLTTGTMVLVSIHSQMQKSTSNSAANVGFAISGATTRAAGTSPYYLYIDGVADAMNWESTGATWLVPVNAGSNTFTMKYRTASATAWYRRRALTVMPL